MADSSFRIDNLISALVGGAAGGLLVWGLMPAPTVATADPATVDEAAAPAPDMGMPSQADDVTSQRLKRLETSVRSVQQRVTEQSKVDVYEEGDDGEGGKKRITLSASDPKFQSAVRSVIDKAKWEQEQLEIDKRDERADRRVATQVDELVEELDLNDEQSTAVENVLRERMETVRALRDGDNRPASRKEWRDRFLEIQADTRKKLGEVLDEEQMTAYDKFQDENGMGPWARGRRPPRPAPQ